MVVGVAVAGVAARAGKLVGDGAGSGAVGSAVGCLPQADRNRAKVRKKQAFFIVRNYIMPPVTKSKLSLRGAFVPGTARRGRCAAKNDIRCVVVVLQPCFENGSLGRKIPENLENASNYRTLSGIK
jgi:hypothetical protein